MAPYSGPLDGTKNNDKQSDIGNIIDLSSGEGRGRGAGGGSLDPGPHGPGARRSAPYPTVEMEEQPAEEYRFRYAPESRTNGSIPGMNSTAEHKTHPAIRILNYIGPVHVYVSCVAKDFPYRPHPHKLVSKEKCCNGGVYFITKNITEDNNVVQFKNIGVQCVKRSEIAGALAERKELKPWYIGDPFKTGIDLRTDATIGMHYVRLGIIVLIQDLSGRCCQPLAPIVSDVITDRPERLRIVKMAPSSGSVLGGTMLILLTDKLPNQQLTVRFHDPSTGWRTEVRPECVHKMSSLVVETPPYRGPETHYPVNVILQLSRPPTGDPVLDRHMIGDPFPFPFEYTPAPPPALPLASPSHTAPKRPRITEKELHKSLLPPKNCLPPNETAPSPAPENRMARHDMPGPSSDFDAKIEKWLQQSTFDQGKIKTPIQTGTFQPSEMGQPPQARQTTSIVPSSTGDQVFQTGQDPRSPSRPTTSNLISSASHYSQATQTTSNKPISQFNQTVQPPPLIQTIPNDQIPTIELFPSIGKPYPAGNSFTVNNTISTGQPAPNGSFSDIDQLQQFLQAPLREKTTPTGPISTIAQSPSVGHSFPVSHFTQMDYSSGQPIPNGQFATEHSSFLVRQISQRGQPSSGESTPIIGSYVEGMQLPSELGYSMSPELGIPYLDELLADQEGPIYPETDAPMSQDGPMKQYYSPESQQTDQLLNPAEGADGANNEPDHEFLAQELDMDALIRALMELKTNERMEAIQQIVPLITTSFQRQ